jgi:hypothetical protein
MSEPDNAHTEPARVYDVPGEEPGNEPEPEPAEGPDVPEDEDVPAEFATEGEDDEGG